MTPFARLALVAGGCALVVGLAAVWVFLAPWAALAAAIAGPVLAALVTVDLAPAAPAGAPEVAPLRRTLTEDVRSG